MKKIPSVIVQAFSKNQYMATFVSGDHSGQLVQVQVDHIEPFFICEGSAFTKIINEIKEKIKEDAYNMAPKQLKEFQEPAPTKKKCTQKRKASAADLPDKQPTKKPHVSTITISEPTKITTPRLPAPTTTGTKRSASYYWLLACSGENLQPRTRTARQKVVELLA